MATQVKCKSGNLGNICGQYRWFVVMLLWTIFIFALPSGSVPVDLPSCNPFHYVPYRSPTVDESSFETIPNLKNSNLNDVIIYWQTIDEDAKCDPKGFGYRAFYALLDGRETIWVPSNVTRENYAIFIGLPSEIGHSIRVHSYNIHGLSKVHTKMFVPGNDDRLEKSYNFTALRFENSLTTYELMWDHSIRLNKGFLQENKISTVKFTIFWCEAFDYERPYQCSGYLDWTHSLEMEVLQRIMPLGSAKKYQFAIAMSGMKKSVQGFFEGDIAYASSGMVWQSCNELSHLVSKTVDKLWASLVSSTVIGLRWKVECDGWTLFDQPLSTIKGGMQQDINYCPVDEKRIPLRCLTGEQKFRNDSEDNVLTSEYAVIPKLKPNTSYAIALVISYSHNWITDYQVFKTEPECKAFSCY